MGNIASPHKLSTDEVDAVQAAWQVVRQDQRSIGQQVMMTLFSENPEYIHKFKHLQMIAADQLPYHTALRAHSLSILYVIHSLIDSMDDEETMRELIRKVALTHKPRSVNRDNFQRFEDAFILVLKKYGIDRRTEEAFHKCILYFTDIYEKAEDT
ncbi:globin-2 B chain [Galendromus occidentalis]|uniref:Globin-2 B chain n=1 Tax=Galendromus occidentalis TaxID=34638 RepID=A0AAJ6QNC6_9ACAR|nr:globin-2 B chain [Galendromus occidentalis]